MTNISTFMVVKDAEYLLPSAISNLRRFSSEVIVIVDDASTDGTMRIATEHADIVEKWPVGGSYESVLNEAASLCSCNWILYSHDDELWSPGFAGYINSMTHEGGQEYAFPRKHIVNDGNAWITTEPWFPDIQLRLRTKWAWESSPWPLSVHSSPVPFHRGYLPIPIWHLKFVVKSKLARTERLDKWGEMLEEAKSEHYRKFSLPEGFTYDVAPVTGDVPEELHEMIEAIKWQIK